MHGTFTWRELLDQMLSGSGLQYQVLDEQTIALGVPSRPPIESAVEADPDRPARQASAASDTDAANTRATSEVYVTADKTGTNLVRSEPIWSPRWIFDQPEIEQSGARTLGDFAQDMTTNFYSINPIAALFGNTAGAVPQDSKNPFLASGLNEHGLGPGTTLCLVDGLRWAGAGLSGTLCDLNFLPLDAVERVVVVPDGDSAVYGADAISGVTNFVLREKFDGADTAVWFDRARGGSRTTTFTETLGKTWERGHFLLAYQYLNQGEILSTGRDYIPAMSSPLAIVPATKISSGILQLSEEIAPDTTLKFTGLYGIRDFSDSNGGFAGYRLARSGTVKELSQTVALEHQPAAGLSVATSATYSRLDQYLATSVPIISSSQHEPGGSLLAEVGVKISATPFELPGGQIETVVGLGARQEKLTVSTSTYDNTYGSETRNSHDFFGEARVPIFGDSNAVTGVQRLELSAAVRYDRYSDFGTTINPRGGIAWAPLPQLNVRATAARSFQPPTLDEIVAIPSYYTDNITENGKQTDTLIDQSQGLHRLKPETAQTFTTGFDYRSTEKQGFRGSLTGFWTRIDNRIAAPPVLGSLANGVDIFSQPALSPYTSHTVDGSWVRTIFSGPGFEADYANQGPSGVKAFFNDEWTNIAQSVEMGLDSIARYTQDSVTGTFEASYLLRDTYRSASGAPTINVLSTLGQAARLRARASLAWSPKTWNLALAANYTSGSRNTLVVPNESIAPWVTADLHASFRIPPDISSLQCLRVTLNLTNLLNAPPPRARIPPVLPYRDVGFDATSASPEGRRVSVGIACLL